MSFPYQAKDIVLVRVACGNIYYAKIVTVNRDDEECMAEFDDGSKASVPWQNIFDVKAETDVIVCVVCKDGTSDTPNEIILCDSCNVGYHQNCHRTLITSAHIAQEKWFCFFCLNKKKNPYLKNPFDEKKERLMKERLARRELNIQPHQPLQEQRPGKRVRQKTKEETKHRPPAKRQALEHPEHPKHHDYPGSTKQSSKCTNKKPLSQKAQQQYKDFNKKMKNPIKSSQAKPGLALKSRPMTITPQNLSPTKRLNYPVPLDLPPLVKSPCPQKGALISPSYQLPPLFKADITSSEHHLFSQLKKLTKPVAESSTSENVLLKSPLISPPKTNIFDSPIFKISPKKGKESSPAKPTAVKKVTYSQKNISLEIDRMYENIQNAHFSLNTLTARSALLEQNTTARIDETIQNILGITPPPLSTPSNKVVPEPVQAVPKFPEYKPSPPQFPTFKLPEVEKKPEPTPPTPMESTSGVAFPTKTNGFPAPSKTNGVEEKGDISVCKAEVMELKAEVMNLEAEIMDFKAGSFSEQPSPVKSEKRTLETLEDCLELELEPLPPPPMGTNLGGAEVGYPPPAIMSLPRAASRPSHSACSPVSVLDQIKIVPTEGASYLPFNTPSPNITDYASSPSPPFANNLQSQLRIVSTEAATPYSFPPSLSSYSPVTTPPSVPTEIHPSNLTVSNILDAAQPYITITPNLDNLVEPSQTISIQQSSQHPLLQQSFSISHSPVPSPLQQSFSISQSSEVPSPLQQPLQHSLQQSLQQQSFSISESMLLEKQPLQKPLQQQSFSISHSTEASSSLQQPLQQSFPIIQSTEAPHYSNPSTPISNMLMTNSNPTTPVSNMLSNPTTPNPLANLLNCGQASSSSHCSPPSRDPMAMNTDPLDMAMAAPAASGLFSPETPVVQFTLFSNYSAFFDSDNEDEDKPSETVSEAQSSCPTTSDNSMERVHHTEEPKRHENSENHTPNNIPQIKQTVEISGQCYFCCSDAKIACRRCAAALYCSSRCELEHSAIHRRECGKPTLAPFS